MRKLGVLLKKYIFFIFSSNHYSFLKYLFMIVVVFYSINYVVNGKTILLLKKTITWIRKDIFYERNMFIFYNFIPCLLFEHRFLLLYD